jgi:hypothetical protein
MKKVKIIAGLIWAFACLVLIIILFPGLSGFAGSLSKAPFMKIHPRYSGGEVARQIVTQNCTLDIRKPVFKGLIGDREDGFVQLDWRGKVPEEIIDTIDYDFDGVADFLILADTKTNNTVLEGFSSKIKDINISTGTTYGWAVRINISK